MRACFATGPYGPQPPALALPNATPRYASGPATFFRCNYEPWRATEADIAIVGVPFDGGVTNRPGARHGPRRVREASADHVRPLARGRSPLELAACVDGGDVAVQRPYALEGAHGEIEAAFRDATLRDVATLAVGGDHSVTLPILRGLVDARGGEPLGLVHLDAHCDTGDGYLGSRFHHGAPFKIAVDEGLLDPKRCVQLGIRGTLAAPDAWAFSTASGMTVIPMDELVEDYLRKGATGITALAAKVAAVVAGPAYLSFDIDVLDPAFAPGTGTPEAGGLATREAQQILRALLDVAEQGALDVVAADLVEVAPPFDAADMTSLAAANLLHDILAILATGVARRRRTS